MGLRRQIDLGSHGSSGYTALPLVRATTRADIVYGEEIIDKKIARCERRENTRLGLVEFVQHGKVVYSTCKEEADRNVFQIRTADAVHALAGAEVICRDVATVDVNMGCPKHFSVSGGM